MSFKQTYVKRNKFNAKKKSYNGRIYDSKLEADYAMQLDWRKKAGEIKEIIPQYKIDLRAYGVHIANYFVDFKVILADGTVEYHEVKGFATDVWRMKWKLTQAQLAETEPQSKLVLVR